MFGAIPGLKDVPGPALPLFARDGLRSPELGSPCGSAKVSRFSRCVQAERGRDTRTSHAFLPNRATRCEAAFVERRQCPSLLQEADEEIWAAMVAPAALLPVFSGRNFTNTHPSCTQLSARPAAIIHKGRKKTRRRLPPLPLC